MRLHWQLALGGAGLALGAAMARSLGRDSITEGILVTDGGGRILMANRALRDLYGLTRELAGSRPAEAVRNATVGEAIEDALAGRGPTFCEITEGGGPPRYLDVHTAPIPGPEGVSGTVTVFYEITRLRRLERMRQDFVANVSHELRTPLTAIKGCAETLADGALRDPSAAQRSVDVINNHADRLTTLLNDLLDLARLESEQATLEPAEVRVARLIDTARDAVSKAAADKGIQLQVAVPSELEARCDRRLIEQALINLVDNALKYTSEEDAVRVSARALSRARAEAELEGRDWTSLPESRGDGGPGRGAVVVEVTDTGIGVPSNEVERVFERFYRVDKGRSRVLGGTGLGPRRRLSRPRSFTLPGRWPSPWGSPVESRGEVAVDEIGVVAAQAVRVGRLRALGVEVVPAEGAQPGQVLQVLVVHQVPVGAFAVDGVEGVVADHVEGGERQVFLDHVIQVLVVAPGHVHAIESAALVVDAAGGGVQRVRGIGVGGEEPVEHDALVEGAAHGVGIADDGPLGLAEEAEDLAEVVDQPREDEPVRMAVPADRLGRLQQVLELGQLGVGVGVVHQLVQVLDGLPDPHPAAPQAQEIPLLLDDEGQGLVAVVLPVELAHRRADIIALVVPEPGGGLAGASLVAGVAGGDEVLPLLEAAQGAVPGPAAWDPP